LLREKGTVIPSRSRRGEDGKLSLVAAQWRPRRWRMVSNSSLTSSGGGEAQHELTCLGMGSGSWSLRGDMGGFLRLRCWRLSFFCVCDANTVRDANSCMPFSFFHSLLESVSHSDAVGTCGSGTVSVATINI
jgi:hypothetical protein